MKVAISQSNYIPWKGYFDLIDKVDVFVLYDDMQYTRRDWRNRNKIKTAQGVQWLTLPVEVKGKYHQKINETRISDATWVDKHLRSLELNYGKATQYSQWFPIISKWYEEIAQFDLLSDVNHYLLRKICGVFNINTELADSRKFYINGSKTGALLSVLEQIKGVSTYISGQAARAYLDLAKFEESNIKVEWMDYHGYSEYPQLYGAFEEGVSILDVLFNVGSDRKYIKSI